MIDSCPKCGKPKEFFLSQCSDCIDALMKGPRPATVLFSATNNPEDYSVSENAGSIELGRDTETAFNCFVCGGLYPWPHYIPLRMGKLTYDDFTQTYGLVCPICVKAKAG